MAHEPATATPYPAQTDQPASGHDSPAGQQALQHIGHDARSGPDAPAPPPATAGTASKLMDHSKMDHSKMDHGKMDHSQMGNGKMGGHDHGAMIADFLRRFWVCLALSVPVVAGSMMFQDLVGYRLTFPYNSPLLLGLATAIYGYGWPCLSGTVG